MDILIAIGHYLGCIAVLMLGSFLFALFDGWQQRRATRATEQKWALELGIPVEQVYAQQHQQAIYEMNVERISEELLANRLSDLCGVIHTLWVWLGWLAMGLVFVYVTWVTITESLENAVAIWAVLGIQVFIAVTGLVFSLVCKLLTGRYPGEARKLRKGMAQLLNDPSSWENV